jgi:hypothetical protein
MGHAEDLAAIQQLAGQLGPGDLLTKVLTEVLAVRPKITSYIDAAGGQAFATTYYTPATHAVSHYTVTYNPGNLGNLVHEMTHVLVNETFRRDMTNYASPGNNPPAPVYNPNNTRQNEAERQTKWMDAGMNTNAISDLQTLMGLCALLRSAVSVTTAPNATITPEQIRKVEGQLMYAAPKPNIEHHTVLNQILVWLQEWGVRGRAKAVVPGQKPTAIKGFVDALERSVQRAADARAAARNG